MYIYIIDTFVVKKKPNIVPQIKNLSKLYDIEGSFIYISTLHDLKKDILNNIKEKTNTIIVVGNCGSLNRIIDLFFQLNKVGDTVFGFISIESDSISKILGMSGVLNKDMFFVSQRLNTKIDVCSINSKYFIDYVNFNFSSCFNMVVDSNCVVNFKNGGNVFVGSMFFDYKNKDLSISNDGFFDILVYSFDNKIIGKFKSKKFNINSKFNIRYSLNNNQYKTNNIEVNIVKEKVKIILSKSSILNNL